MKDLLPVAALLGLPMFFAYSNYLYDPSTIFLFTFCLTLLVRRTWGRYLVAFAISALNKETTVLLGIIFALHHFPKKGRMDWRTYGTLLVPQVAIYLASRFALGKLFGNNPGDYFLWHLKDHQFPLLRAYQPSSYVTALALFCAVAGHWQEKPAVLKSGLWILVPLLGMAIFFGFMDEYRAFYEAYPLVLMLGAFTAARLMAVPLRTTELGAPT